MDFIQKHKNLIFVIVILVLSILTHFLFWGYPAETVFDEVHFGKFVSGYYNGEYFFDIHPPLGKLLITAAGSLGGYSNNFNFENIGEKYPDSSFVWLRLVPLIAGTLLPLVIYFLARKLKFSELASFIAALIIVFENSLLVQSRFILLDSMLLLFGFLGLFLYLKAKEEKSILFFILAGISFGACASIKWTGLGFIGLIIVWEFFVYILDRTKKEEKFTQPLFKILILVFSAFVVYFFTFVIHFSILKKSGTGNAFMSPSFQKSLAENNYQNDSKIKEANLFSKFYELNLEMYRSNKRISNGHPYESKWYSWPIMQRPIYYWNSQDEGDIGRIYFLGNPVIYWAAFFAILIIILSLILHPEWRTRKKWVAFFILAGFLINFLPFIFIKRPMFTYHYLTSLIFGVLALVYLVEQIKNAKLKKIVIVVLLIVIISTFLFLAPLSFGIPISEGEFINRIWFPTWQ